MYNASEKRYENMAYNRCGNSGSAWKRDYSIQSACPGAADKPVFKRDSCGQPHHDRREIPQKRGAHGGTEMENFAPCADGQGAFTIFLKFKFILDLDVA